MNKTLARILGFDKNVFGPVIRAREAHTFEAQYPVQLKHHFHLFVYADIVEPSLVGDTEAQLIGVIPLDHGKDWGESCFSAIMNPQYHPINKTFISDITIRLMDDTGKPIQFEMGKSLIKLHVRRKRLHLPV